MGQFFPERYEFKIEIQKADLKEATGVDTSDLANLWFRSDLANLKTIVDKIDIDKLKTPRADLSKLSNVVDNEYEWIN